jgi:hypothetical protein
LLVVTTALLDTGSELSLFDAEIATRIGLPLDAVSSLRISGIGGETLEAKLAEVALQFLNRPELSITAEVAFAVDIELKAGNLIGLDVLSYFDFGLSHANRIGYLGRAVV